MKGIESMQNITPLKDSQEQPETIEQLQAKAEKQRIYEEKVLSPSALATKMVVEAGLKKKLEDMPETELIKALETNFEAIELSPIDYANSNIIKIKELLQYQDISKAAAIEIRKLIKACWTDLSTSQDVPKKEATAITNYLITVEQLLENKKL